ncbi:MAG: bifunctional diguanylate cyclase/phosphodiesterase [Bauldia sp.]|nr:bifunctional diguanylate cyclase/phosphodiesterase [Bauldia sp.]
MGRTITSRITINLVAGIVITVITVFVAVFWMASRQDEQAARSTDTMVVGGVSAIARRAESLASDYGWWDDAYKAYVNRDAEWFATNYGESVEETEVANLFAIISTEGTIDYHWTLGDAVAIDEVLTPDVIAQIREMSSGLRDESLAAERGIVATESAPMVVAVSRITPFLSDPDIDPSTLPLLVVGLALDEDRLGQLGQTFLINDLHFEPAGAEAEASVFPPALDIFGNTIGHYVWTPPRPGNAVLRSVLPPIGVALAIFCVVAFVTAFRARKIAIALTDSEKEASIAARTDGMTGLKNRTGFNELLDSPHFQTACKSGELAVIYLDINGFKAVNDSIGHNGGDELVKALTIRLKSVLPPDALFARIGGDEFAVALTGRSVRDTAAGAASAIVHSLDQPFTIHGFEFHVTVAVGYAVAGGTGLTPSEIVRRADIAMYHAKNGAEREAIAYHSTMETGALEKKQVEIALRRAVEEGDLQVNYQPVVRASDLSIVGVEALVRWTSKEFGTVSPSLFIPVAEETGLIHDVGRLVIDRACQDMLRWPGLKMAINISPVQLRDPNFADDILGVVERHGLSPDQFELELTEGILVNNPTIAKRKLAHLKSMGFTLSLDDFGTGFSSIGYLRQFPFDILKVDRSFVRDLGINSTANALVQSLVSLGDAMDLSVIAEGIENEDQLKLLRLVQCEYLQGFLISRPLPAAELMSLLDRLGEGRRFPIGREPERRAAAG